jgi:hypothetical protein
LELLEVDFTAQQSSQVIHKATQPRLTQILVDAFPERLPNLAYDGKQEVREVNIVDINIFRVSFKIDDKVPGFAFRRVGQSMLQAEKFCGLATASMPGKQHLEWHI